MIYTIASIIKLCQTLNQKGIKVVLVTGFFDLLHQEHINFLKKARALGDVLIVAVESDARARLLKGEGRPVQTQDLRINNIVQYCDYVIKLGANFNNRPAFESLIQAVMPSVLAVSSHTAHQDKKDALVSKYGGKLVIAHLHNPDISTTNTLKENTQRIIS